MAVEKEGVRRDQPCIRILNFIGIEMILDCLTAEKALKQFFLWTTSVKFKTSSKRYFLRFLVRQNVLELCSHN